jgi:hypothetical protein
MSESVVFLAVRTWLQRTPTTKVEGQDSEPDGVEPGGKASGRAVPRRGKNDE